jgi:hypothetical protein
VRYTCQSHKKKIKKRGERERERGEKEVFNFENK